MSWEYVFRQHLFAFHIRDNAAKAAYAAGYHFLQWNAEVLFIVDAEGTTMDTGITADKLY